MHLLIGLALLLNLNWILPHEPFYDRTHPSKVFGQQRNYRIFLPGDYEASGKWYPVIYYFHGHSDRYTLEHYDGGTDTVPKIASFVSRNDVIVVAVDGYVAGDYTGFYGGSPWDVRLEGGAADFGVYFQELVAHIDATYRTLRDRRHRATSGLSMGAFMSLYLSARYPDLVGSASAFNPGPEFYAGDTGRRVLWRPKDHVSNHSQTMVRLVRASGDYISQYHEETRAAYARADKVDFEYRQDEYHRHWATSIEETFSFHQSAFAKPALDNVPVSFDHADPYRRFEVWGYRVEVTGERAALTYLQSVTQGGFRIATRAWAPDGPAAADLKLRVTTAPRYSAGQSYTVLDHRMADGTTSRSQAVSDSEGRLAVTVDGAGHQVSFVGPGTGGLPPVLLPLTAKDTLRLAPGRELSLPIRIYNPRGEPMKDVRLELSSETPTVGLLSGSTQIPVIESGARVDVSEHFRVRLTSGGGYFLPARLQLKVTYDGWHETSEPFDVLIIPEVLPESAAVEILDGRTMTFAVFRQAGNQGGGTSVKREVTEGRGNGNGLAEPGEEITVWVRMTQGMDPFDKNNWYRCKVYTESPWITEVADMQDEKQREWTGAKQRTSRIRIAPDVPAGTRIPLLLDNESWSFHYTPEVRYGRERLYQAFQLHKNHLHKYELVVAR